MRNWLILLLVVTSATLSCQSQNAGQSSTLRQVAIGTQVFNDSVTEFNIHVFYEVGATPYTGAIGLSGNDTWDITRISYEDLFQNHPGRTVSVPSTLGQMTEIPDQNKGDWSSSSLEQLAKMHTPDLTAGTRVHISVIFLNGKFEGKSNVLGVQLNGHPYAFVFKDVVTGAGGDSVSQRYVEQATVVHEIGHAIGLVNNGVPMVDAHEDPSHSHHTTNTDCVMYWAVKSQEDILSSLANIILTNRLSLFGAESLQDGRTYHPSP